MERAVVLGVRCPPHPPFPFSISLAGISPFLSPGFSPRAKPKPKFPVREAPVETKFAPRGVRRGTSASLPSPPALLGTNHDKDTHVCSHTSGGDTPNPSALRSQRGCAGMKALLLLLHIPKGQGVRIA